MDRLPGFRDFFPSPIPQKDQGCFEERSYLFGVWREVLARYGFREYDGPPLESLALFTKKSGEEIANQVYHFEDKAGRAVALRPEMTPTLARMIAAAQRHYKKPMKWFSIPQLFRYERKQKGRLREHFQLNADIIGEANLSADAELIALMIDVLRSLGLTSDDFVVRLSSRNAWQSFFQKHAISQNALSAVFQIIDKIERMPESSAREGLANFGISLDEVENFIQKANPDSNLRAVLDNLRARGLDAFVKVDYGIVRGLDYYTGVVFEAFDKRGEFRAIAGGGRYDELIALISENKTQLPALGFGMGDVVLTELLRSRNLLPDRSSKLDIYCLIDEESQRTKALALIQSLRESGFRVDYSFIPQKPKRQRREANARARLVLSFSEDALSVCIRRLSDQHETIVPIEKSQATLQTLLKNPQHNIPIKNDSNDSDDSK